VTSGVGYQRGCAAAALVHGGAAPTRDDRRRHGQQLHGSRRRATAVQVFPPLRAKWSTVALGQSISSAIPSGCL
jgi:hypothetical protein